MAALYWAAIILLVLHDLFYTLEFICGEGNIVNCMQVVI